MSLPAISRWSGHLALLLLALPLTGCITYKHIPAAPVADVQAPEVLRSRTATVAPPPRLALVASMPGNRRLQARMAESTTSWFAPPAGGTVDYQVEYNHSQKATNGGQFGATFVLYLFTGGGLPFVGTMNEQSEMIVRANGEEVFRDTQVTQVRRALTVWTPFALFAGSMGAAQPTQAVDHLVAGHRAALNRRINEEQLAFSAAAAAGTAAAFGQYLDNHPRSFFRGEALRRLSQLAARSSNPLAAHKPYAARYPDYVRYIDGNDALWFVGPPGMQVMDIAPAIRRGTGAELLASQIRAARQPYKVFSEEELAQLKRRGVPDAVAAAMLDVTREVGVAAAVTAPDSGVQAAGGGALFATMAAPAAASNGATMAPATPAQPEDLGAKVAGGAAECAKAYIAKKACEKIPDPTPFGFAIKACIKQVKKTYGGAGCPLL